MEEKNPITIPLTGENEEKEELSDPLASTYPTWSTRRKCCQTYLCLSMSFLSVMKFCGSLAKFGFVILVPYLTFTVILGAPGVLVEILFGRYGGGNILRTWNMCPPARGLFICLFFVTSCLIIERNLLNVYVLKYFFSCFYGRIQWDDCNVEWAGDNCYVVGRKKEAYLLCVKKHSQEYCDSLKWETSATQYWKHIVTNSRGLNVLWTITCLTMSILITLGVAFKGIYSLEKALTHFMYPVVALCGILGVISLSVPNAVTGFIKLCRFGWWNIGNFNLWTVGFFDIFLCNCVGTLALSFISGHGNFTDNIIIDVFTVTFISIISCLIFTVPVLCVIKSVTDTEQEYKMNVSDNVEVISIISQAFLLYPVPKVVWTALYFLSAFFMSLSSQAILLLALAEALQNIFKRKSVNFWVMTVSGISFVLTILVGALRIRAYLDVGTALAINFFLGTLTWQLFYGIENFKTDFYFMMGYPMPFLIRCTWITLLILPVALLSLMFYARRNSLLQDLEELILSVTVLLIYIFNILYYMIKTKKEKGKIITVFTANPAWGPDNPLLKKSRKLFGVSTVTREFTYRQELNKKPLMKPPNFSNQNIVNVI